MGYAPTGRRLVISERTRATGRRRNEMRKLAREALSKIETFEASPPFSWPLGKSCAAASPDN